MYSKNNYCEIVALQLLESSLKIVAADLLNTLQARVAKFDKTIGEARQSGDYSINREKLFTDDDKEKFAEYGRVILWLEQVKVATNKLQLSATL